MLEVHTAGDPVRDGVRWTNLTRQEIADGLSEFGWHVSVTTVDGILAEEGFSRRKMQKAKSLAVHADRDEQFRRIAELRAEHLETGDPVLSIDAKQKVILGDYSRGDAVLSQRPLRAYDHDFIPPEAKCNPYGVYDLRHNLGYCQWALKGDQRKALQRRPVGRAGRESVRWVVWHDQPPSGADSWRTDWRWIKYKQSRA